MSEWGVGVCASTSFGKQGGSPFRKSLPMLSETRKGRGGVSFPKENQLQLPIPEVCGRQGVRESHRGREHTGADRTRDAEHLAEATQVSGRLPRSSLQPVSPNYCNWKHTGSWRKFGEKRPLFRVPGGWGDSGTWGFVFSLVSGPRKSPLGRPAEPWLMSKETEALHFSTQCLA